MSKLILGTVQMGLIYGINNSKGKIPKEECFSIFSYAFENDIKYLDTAEVYGDAHKIIGEFHRLNPDKEFKIITKVPASLDTSILEKVTLYLEELSVKQLDTLMFHSFDTFVKRKSELEEVVQMKADGLIKNFGVSVYTNDEADTLIEDNLVDVIQIPFNVFDNFSKKGDLLQKAKDKGKIIHSRSAFLQGLFFKDRDSDNYLVNSLHEELGLLDEITSSSKMDLNELLIGYCIQQPFIDQVLIGVDSLEQLKENIACSKKTVSTSTVDRINRISIVDENLLNPSLWKK